MEDIQTLGEKIGQNLLVDNSPKRISVEITNKLGRDSQP